MAKYKPTNEDQMVMLPISLQDQLVPGTLEHTINRLVDENIDLSVFDERYKNDVTGSQDPAEGHPAGLRQRHDQFQADRTRLP